MAGVATTSSPLTEAVLVRDDALKQPLLVVGKSWCPHTQKVKRTLSEALSEQGVQYAVLDLDTHPNGVNLQEAFSKLSGIRTVPQVFIGGQCLGGCDATMDALKRGVLWAELKKAGVAMHQPESDAVTHGF